MPFLAIGPVAGAAVGGLSAAEVGLLSAASVVAAAVTMIGAIEVIEIIDDYLDGKAASEAEVNGILDKAGDKSKAEQRKMNDCADCVWCMINIQAQGTMVDVKDRTAPQGIGPYLVKGRTVTAREGTIVAGATHEFAKGRAGKKDFKQIEKWGVLAKTIKYIQTKPPHGLPNGEHRVGAKSPLQDTQIRYDIMVFGTINAFME